MRTFVSEIGLFFYYETKGKRLSVSDERAGKAFRCIVPSGGSDVWTVGVRDVGAVFPHFVGRTIDATGTDRADDVSQTNYQLGGDESGTEGLFGTSHRARETLYQAGRPVARRRGTCPEHREEDAHGRGTGGEGTRAGEDRAVHRPARRVLGADLHRTGKDEH